MATKRITDVDYAQTFNDNDSIFINQNDCIKQISKNKVSMVVKISREEYEALGDVVKTNGIFYAIAD